MRTLSVNYQNNRRNIFWPYENSTLAAYDLGIGFQQNKGNTPEYMFEGDHIMALLGRMFSPNHYLSLNVGTHILKKSTDAITSTEHALTTEGLDYSYIKGFFQLHFEFKKDFMYSNLFLPAGVQYDLIENKFELVAKIKTLGGTEYSTSIKHSLINDDNQFTSFNAGIVDVFELHPLYFFGGVNVNYGQSRFTTQKYPSPWYILGAGPQFGVNYAPSDILTLSLGYSYTRSVDNLKVKGSEENKFIQVEFGNRNSLEMTLSYIKMSSLSLGEKWYDDQLNFSLNFSI
ncbi:MAG: hypothetical protein HYV97_14895 [Bdellovibrio sp.]|nr:hypothetical protein [Bdellovibrio sp.]